jgi:hypothetical protein
MGLLMANILVSMEFITNVYKLVALLDGYIDDPAIEKIQARIETETTKKLKHINAAKLLQHTNPLVAELPSERRRAINIWTLQGF